MRIARRTWAADPPCCGLASVERERRTARERQRLVDELTDAWTDSNIPRCEVCFERLRYDPRWIESQARWVRRAMGRDPDAADVVYCRYCVALRGRGVRFSPPIPAATAHVDDGEVFVLHLDVAPPAYADALRRRYPGYAFDRETTEREARAGLRCYCHIDCHYFSPPAADK